MTTDPNPDNNTASATANVSLPGADLGVTIHASTPSLLEGGLVTYFIGVTNNGPSDAQQVTVFNSLPANVNLISTATSQGTVTSDGSIANLGTPAVRIQCVGDTGYQPHHHRQSYRDVNGDIERGGK